MIKFNFKRVLTILLILIGGFLLFSYYLQKQLLIIYTQQNSTKIEDRNGKEIIILQNQNGNFARYLDKIPPRFKKLLIKKEDKYFYYHFGFNPWSLSQATFGRLGLGSRKASSTISQQLVKILLKKELERNLKNKIIEAFYALSLEIYQNKEEILKMYVNSVYFGNRAQGLTEASQFYFNLSPDMLTDGQILQLLATIHSPTETNPAKSQNKEIALSLAKKLNLGEEELIVLDSSEVKKNIQKYSRSDNAYFEIHSLLSDLDKNRQLTIDKALTEKIRQIVKRNIEDFKPKNVQNGAVIVIKLPENEILALIGSPDSQSSEPGNQINMLDKPRSIGSTIKPFIYLKAFEKGLRPYTLVEDREYKYITALGFPLYPKNFDYKYRGEVNLHYALSNSLNVPSLKVLEYVELDNFYNFLEKELEFKPIQSLDNYQLGIALGALEMNLFDLSKYFTIFPNNGVLKEIKIYQDENYSAEKEIAEPQYVQLVNKILNDRKTGIEQFGLESELNLFQKNYALKTGTSRDFKDSWVIGYTPDFLVGVWIGNADNSPTEEVSGQIGAGVIWSETMELLLNSEYNKKTPFEFNLIKEFRDGENIEYGLSSDSYEKSLNALKEKEVSIILNPYDGDVFLLEENTKIILKAREDVNWFINEEFWAKGKNVIFTPRKLGVYQIKAVSPNGSQEMINILIND